MGPRGAAVLVMVMAAGILAACGTTPAGTSADSSDPLGTRAGTSSSAPSGSSSGSAASTGLGMALAAIDPAKLPATRSAVGFTDIVVVSGAGGREVGGAAHGSHEGGGPDRVHPLAARTMDAATVSQRRRTGDP